MQQCKGLTQKGKRCENRASIEGYCVKHFRDKEQLKKKWNNYINECIENGYSDDRN